MNTNHLSSGGRSSEPEMQEYYRRRKLARYTSQKKFLLECIAEQVIPKSVPKQLRNSDHPFSEGVRTYLEEACNSLTDKLEELRESGNNMRIPRHLVEKLSRENSENEERQRRKLSRLCDNSEWNNVGRVELITNISSRQLTRTETQALSLGLKFDIGRDRRKYADYLATNYKHSDSDVEKGFIQGVLLCYKALSNEKPYSVPKRYITALHKLGKCEDIVITTADKGGGVVVMDRADYKNKMMDLLNDDTTYEKKHVGFAKEEAEKFVRETRKILRKSDRGKKLLNLLEEAPRPPRMRGLPKTHKPNIPMRPITSGIGSAPHRLAKRLAQPLSRSLGTISNSHLKNSTDLINRLESMNFNRKKLVSFDVKSLFTNVPVDGALEAIVKAVDKINEEDLPVHKRDYIKLIALCMNFGAFTFEGEEYVQCRGLAMGSPISAVAACLYMEVLEEEKFKRIIGRNSSWMRYVDDILAVVPVGTNIDNKLRMLNNVDQNIQFTVEHEQDNKIPFLDTLIHKDNQRVKFSVYRKSTNKDDFIHFFSAHNRRTKTGVLIGFYLRAMRICNEEFLDDELKYIKSVFTKLRYPPGLINKTKRKAMNITNRERSREQNLGSYLAVPNSENSVKIDRLLQKAGMRLAHKAGTRIKDITRHNNTGVDHGNGIIYQIPCGNCHKAYYGESGRDLTKRIYEHRLDFRAHRNSNSLVVHRDEFSHLPAWQEAEVLHKGLDKKERRMIESAYILSKESMNHREGFYRLSKTSAHWIMTETFSQSARRMDEVNQSTTGGGGTDRSVS